MKKEISMSINQFMEMERGNISLNDIKKENGFETTLEKLINNEDFQFACITMGLATVIAIFNQTSASATTLGGEQLIIGLNQEGMKTLQDVIKNITYGTCAFAGIHEVRKAIKIKSWKKIPIEIIRYGLAFSVVFFADDFFKLILETVPNIAETFNFNDMINQIAYSNNLDVIRQI